MTRHYPHRPDVVFAATEYPCSVELVETGHASLGGWPIPSHSSVRVSLDGLWEALAWGWLLERPSVELRPLVERGPDLVRAALDAPPEGGVRLDDMEMWVATALLAGDDALAQRAATYDAPLPTQEGEWPTATVLALVRGDEDAAAAGAAELRAIVAAPTTPPDVAVVLAHVDEVADAVVRRDQDAFGAALVARRAAVARAHRTVQERRSWTAVLDPSAVAFALAAVRRGLVVPAGVDVAPAELLASLGAAREG